MMAGQNDVYALCQPLLQSTEVIKVAVRIAAPGSTSNSQDVAKILVLVSNVDSGIEEAALLSVLDRQSPPIEGVVPIYADFEVAFEQVETSSTASLENAGQPVQACFGAKFLSDAGKYSISVTTTDLELLEDILKEARRLTEIAEQRNLLATSGSHTWLAHYAGSGRSRSFSTASAASTQASVATWFQYGNKAIEGLPALASTFGSFGFFSAGASPPAAHTRALPGSWDPPQPQAEQGAQRQRTLSASRRYRTKRVQDAEMHKKLAARQADFTRTEKIKLHVCTYNCSGQFYDPETDLSRWISVGNDPDLVVVGLQEMDLRPEVLMVRHDASVREAWCKGVLTCLNKHSGKKGEPGTGKDGEYRLLETKQLAGLCVLLFSKEALLEDSTVDEIATASVMTGWAGFAGNKGACCLRLRLHDSYVSLVCAHLAAFQDMTDRRNADFVEITKRAIFSSSGSGTAPNSPNGHAHLSTYSTVLDADLCVFFGDLNYRLDDLSIHEIRELIASRSLTTLRKHDQLKASRQAGKAFCGFEEGKLDFQPTYKFDKRTDKYDSSEKERKPAWTDRVLWKINEDQIEYLEDGERISRLKVTCEEYASIMELRMSDHKPVLARLHIELDVVDEEAFNSVLHELEQDQRKA